MTQLQIAFIAAAQIVLLAAMNYWAASRKDLRDGNRRDKERKEDWDRQDAVANQAREAARLLLNAQKESISRTDEVAKVAAETNKNIQSQLVEVSDQGRKIHALVNSDMTAARTNERNQTVLTLAALKRVQLLSTNLGIGADQKEIEAIREAELRIKELDAILADRLAAQHALDAE
jgi:hypothetical protein